MRACVRACVCVRVCERVSVRARVRACVRACVCNITINGTGSTDNTDPVVIQIAGENRPVATQIRPVTTLIHWQQIHKSAGGTTFNPFTVMLASVSPGKQPVKVPNLKPLRLFFPLLYEHVEGLLLKCTALKVDLL